MHDAGAAGLQVILNCLPFGLADDSRDVGDRVLLVGFATAVLVVGEVEPVLALGSLFSLNDSLDAIFGPTANSLRSKIERHMVHNERDWTVEYLFTQIGAISCSRARFAALLEASVHPLARRPAAKRHSCTGRL